MSTDRRLFLLHLPGRSSVTIHEISITRYTLTCYVSSDGRFGDEQSPLADCNLSLALRKSKANP
jgi:hypothetical protein